MSGLPANLVQKLNVGIVHILQQGDTAAMNYVKN